MSGERSGRFEFETRLDMVADWLIKGTRRRDIWHYITDPDKGLDWGISLRTLDRYIRLATDRLIGASQIHREKETGTATRPIATTGTKISGPKIYKRPANRRRFIERQLCLPVIESGAKNNNIGGWVYVIGDLSGLGLYKIGMTTKKPDKRIQQFAPKLPFSTEIVLAIETRNPSRLERMLHSQFAKRRTSGEWFELTDQDIEDIRSQCE